MNIQKKKYTSPSVRTYESAIHNPFAGSPNTNPWADSRRRQEEPWEGGSEEFGSKEFPSGGFWNSGSGDDAPGDFRDM